MTTEPVKSLIDSQLDDIESKLVLLGFGLPINEMLGVSRDTPVASLPRQVGVSLKGGRTFVRYRPAP